jgi:molybdate transport system substrate-binding protein
MKARITVLSSMATRQVLAELATLFEPASDCQVAIESIGGLDAVKRVRAGEAWDVIVLASEIIDQLTAAGRIAAGSKVDLVRSGVAVAVRSGAPKPEIGSEEAVRKAVQRAARIAYSTGPSGVYLAKLFERWGIAEEIRARLVLAPPGVPVGSIVASGGAELGFQQLSELMPIAGIDVIGPLPAPIQVITTFSAGQGVESVHLEPVRKLLSLLASPAAAEVKRRNWLEPA